jgi:uncharacterized protein YrrD
MRTTLRSRLMNGEPVLAPGLLHREWELIGYSVEARGARIGEVADVVLDRDGVAVKGLLIETHNGKPSLLHLRLSSIQSIDPAERRIVIHE